MNIDLIIALAALITALATALGTLIAARNKRLELKRASTNDAIDNKKKEAEITNVLIGSADVLLKNDRETITRLGAEVEELKAQCSKFRAEMNLLIKERDVERIEMVNLKNTSHRLVLMSSRLVRGIRTLICQLENIKVTPEWTPSDSDVQEIERMVREYNLDKLN